jgi:hypothetical protein
MPTFEKPNVTYTTVKILRDRIIEVIDGDTKLLFVGGPPGIAKTTMYDELMRDHYTREEAKWRQLPHHLRTEANTEKDDFGIDRFRNPTSAAGDGRCTPRSLYMHMYEHSSHGDIIVVDDPGGLENKETQGILMQASDRVRQFGVKWEVSTKLGKWVGEEFVLFPKHFNFWGGLIVITNLSEEEYETQISEALRSRAKPLFFTWDYWDVRDYVHTLAFKDEGTIRILQSFESGIDKAKAMVMLLEIRDFVIEHDAVPDLRLFYHITYDRWKYPHDWRERALKIVNSWRTKLKRY